MSISERVSWTTCWHCSQKGCQPNRLLQNFHSPSFGSWRHLALASGQYGCCTFIIGSSAVHTHSLQVLESCLVLWPASVFLCKGLQRIPYFSDAVFLRLQGIRSLQLHRLFTKLLELDEHHCRLRLQLCHSLFNADVSVIDFLYLLKNPGFRDQNTADA